MAESIESLAKLLNLSEKALDNRRRKIRMANPKDVEGQLLAWLKAAYEENRDIVKIPGKTHGYVETTFGEAVPYHGAVLPGRTQDGYEVESVRDDVQTAFSDEATAVFDVLKGEEKLKKQAKARAERLRQAELELRRKGKSPDHYLQAVEEAVKAMKEEARAA